MKKFIILTIALININTYSANAIELGSIAADVAKSVATDTINQQKDQMMDMYDQKVEELGNEAKEDLRATLNGEEPENSGDTSQNTTIKRTYKQYRKAGEISSNDIPKVFGDRYYKLSEKNDFSSYKKTKQFKYSFKDKELPKKIWE